MKKIVVLLVFLSLGFNAFSQILEPVKWKFTSKKIAEKEYELTFTADIDGDWAVYSQTVASGGPIPTSFTFDENKDINFIGKVIESKRNRITKLDPVFDMKVTKFYKQAIFKQKVKLKSKSVIVTGNLTFMACDDDQCLPPKDVTFQFEIKNY